MADVVMLRAVEKTGFDFNACLDRFKDRPLTHLLIIAADDTIEIDGNLNVGEALLIMEQAKDELKKDESE